MSQLSQFEQGMFHVPFVEIISSYENKMVVLINALNSDFPNLFDDQIVLRAVHGMNQTDTLIALLNTGVQFHNLSKGGRSWGKLATWLTKYRALKYQIDHNIRFAVTVEDDVIPDKNWKQVNRVSDNRRIVKYSRYAEVYVTTLEAARIALERLKMEGIQKNDDQQFFWRGSSIQKFYKNVFKLTRKTNRGVIMKTPALTWMEMAMLRKITSSATFNQMYFGNPKNYNGESCWSLHRKRC